MYGLGSAATSADGTAAPNAMTVKVLGIEMHQVGEATNTELLKDGEAEYKILSRPQAIYINDDTTDYEGNSYDLISVRFAAAVKVFDQDGVSHDLTLTTATQTLNLAFTVEKHENRQLTIKTAWGKTIRTDEATGAVTILQPSFTLTFDE